MSFRSRRGALLALCAAAAAQTAEVRIRLEAGAFVAEGAAVAAALRAEPPERLLRVYVEDAPPDSPAVAGEYEKGAERVTFRPRYPLRDGLRYRARWRDGAGVVLAAPSAAQEPAAYVERVYPSAEFLPENQLKFYLHFSAPMSRGEAYRRIHLKEEGRGEVSLPFLELDQELWDRDGRRLTLLFDPGRIKRGVLPREEVGSALEPGRRYSLEIDREWADASGRPLREGFQKRFSAGEADRVPLDASRFRVSAPAAGSREPVEVDFGEPVDAALALRLLEVADRHGARVTGAAALGKEERRWLFTPEASWVAGRYEVRIASTLEDLAGNRIGRAFDVDRFERVESKAAVPETVTLRFRIRARSR